ncbi:MAG TPA: DnaB-like helicase C-terminal domain-containing protein [bacterium]
MEEISAVERSLLSGFIRDRYLLGRAVDAGFTSDLMPHALGRNLARLLVEVYGERDMPLEPVAVRAVLAERGSLTPEMRRFVEAVLATTEPDAARVMAYVELLRARAARLRLVEVNTEISRYLEEERSEDHDLVDFVGKLIPTLLEIQRQRLSSSMPSVSDVGSGLVKEMLAGDAAGLGYRVAPFEKLTEALSGLRRGFYYGLAGAPRRGKTNLALELAMDVAAQYRIPVLYFTWEQTKRVLFARLLGKEMLINPTTLLTPAGTDPQIRGRLRDSWTKMERDLATLYLFEAGRHDTVDRIRARAHNLMHALQTDECVIFIDYLQRVPLDEPVHDEKSRTDLISGKLADLSLELNCPVFAISPLDKEGCRLDERPSDEISEFARPTMHHSVGSGDLEYDLDVAMVLAKDWVATKNLEDLLRSELAGRNGGTVPRIDVLDLHLDKNRDAPDAQANAIQYAFFVNINKFVELGFKSAERFTSAFRDFAKMREALDQLRQRGLITVGHDE